MTDSVPDRPTAAASTASSTSARAIRRMTALLAAAAIILVAGLAALPFFANRPRAAPPVTLATLNGEVQTLAALRGGPVLVSFWSTTCAPCVAETPAMKALHEHFAARGLRTFAVAMAQDRPDQVVHFARTRGLPFEVVLDVNGQLARAFNDTQTTPTKFLIDRDGRIIRTYVGSTDFDDLVRRIESALAG